MLLQFAVGDIGQVTEIEPCDVRRIKCHTNRLSAQFVARSQCFAMRH
jgi:hypothetical protein